VENQRLIKDLQKDLARRKRERKKAEDKKYHVLVSWLDGYITAYELVLLQLIGQGDTSITSRQRPAVAAEMQTL
jgi:hypothetical protein